MSVCSLTYLEVSRLLLSFLIIHQWTPLHVAAERGRCEKILGDLVDKGGDINTKDNKGVNIIY